MVVFPESESPTTTSSVSLITESTVSPSLISTITQVPETIVPTNQPTPGAVAGAAIGCLIGGLAIGYLIAFLVMKNTKRRENNKSFVEYPAQSAYEPNGCKPSPATVTEKSQISLDQFLLDSTPDHDIGSELKSLSELIQNHVENNYHLNPVRVNSPALNQTLINLGLGKKGDVATSIVVARALDPRTRHTALSHVISYVLFSSVDFNSRSRLSMLPTPIAAFLQSVPSIELSTSSVEATNAAMNKWRSLSAFLLHPGRNQRTPLVPSETALELQIITLASALETFLEPFVPSDHSANHQQDIHLRAIIFECTKFGYMLLSQPSEWKLDFGSPSSNEIQWMTTRPGLEKLGGRDGARYDCSVEVVAPTRVRA